MDAPAPPRRSIPFAAIAGGLIAATLVIAPVAAWFHSRAKQERIDRQTRDRLR